MIMAFWSGALSGTGFLCTFIMIYVCLGLCGTFDGDQSNDLMLRDGTLSTDGSDRPYDFCYSWR